MSFTDMKPRKATEAHCKASWGGEKNGKLFRCSLCGHKFTVGDVFRWQMMGSYKMTNLMVCSDCDGSPDELAAKYKKLEKEFNASKYWHFRRE